MTTAYELKEIKKAVCGRTKRRPATDAEIDYVLNLDPLAERVESDKWSLFWDDGQGECSTQRPWDL